MNPGRLSFALGEATPGTESVEYERVGYAGPPYTPWERGTNGSRVDGYPGPLQIMWEEPWADMQQDFRLPQNTLQTAHYVWCETKESVFLFRDYLSVLSVLRMVMPVRVVIHYNTLPQDDALYNKWFTMLKGTVPDLEFKQFPASVKCMSHALLEHSLTALGITGGVVFGRYVLLAHAPRATSGVTSLHLTEESRGTEQGLVVSAGHSQGVRWKEEMEGLVSASKPCVSVKEYNDINNPSQVLCINMEAESRLFPREIMTGASRFAQLARWIFYGRRTPLEVLPDPSRPIPRISHFVRFASGGMYNELHLNHYLSILSALHVGGFHRVYLHVDKTPSGRWWKDLTDRGENITLIPVDKALSVFQQPVKVIQHQSDIVRFLLLHKYGGAYQDLDVLWVSRVPDRVLAYPAVVAPDSRDKVAADRFNNGVFLSRPQGAWVRHVIDSFHQYYDAMWSYNSAVVPYRMFELHPDTVLVDKRLQVLCHSDYACCPWWVNASRCAVDMKKAPDVPLGWREGVMSFHVVMAKPHPTLKTLDTIKKGKDIFAKFAKMILEKSGRQHLLK